MQPSATAELGGLQIMRSVAAGARPVRESDGTLLAHDTTTCAVFGAA